MSFLKRKKPKINLVKRKKPKTISDVLKKTNEDSYEEIEEEKVSVEKSVEIEEKSSSSKNSSKGLNFDEKLSTSYQNKMQSTCFSSQQVVDISVDISTTDNDSFKEEISSEMCNNYTSFFIPPAFAKQREHSMVGGFDENEDKYNVIGADDDDDDVDDDDSNDGLPRLSQLLGTDTNISNYMSDMEIENFYSEPNVMDEERYKEEVATISKPEKPKTKSLNSYLALKNKALEATGLDTIGMEKNTTSCSTSIGKDKISVKNESRIGDIDSKMIHKDKISDIRDENPVSLSLEAPGKSIVSTENYTNINDFEKNQLKQCHVNIPIDNTSVENKKIVSDATGSLSHQNSVPEANLLTDSDTLNAFDKSNEIFNTLTNNNVANNLLTDTDKINQLTKPNNNNLLIDSTSKTDDSNSEKMAELAGVANNLLTETDKINQLTKPNNNNLLIDSTSKTDDSNSEKMAEMADDQLNNYPPANTRNITMNKKDSQIGISSCVAEEKLKDISLTPKDINVDKSKIPKIVIPKINNKTFMKKDHNDSQIKTISIDSEIKLPIETSSEISPEKQSPDLQDKLAESSIIPILNATSSSGKDNETTTPSTSAIQLYANESMFTKTFSIGPQIIKAPSPNDPNKEENVIIKPVFNFTERPKPSNYKSLRERPIISYNSEETQDAFPSDDTISIESPQHQHINKDAASLAALIESEASSNETFIKSEENVTRFLKNVEEQEWLDTKIIFQISENIRKDHMNSNCSLSSVQEIKIVDANIYNHLRAANLLENEFFDLDDEDNLLNSDLSLGVYDIQKIRENLYSINKLKELENIKNLNNLDDPSESCETFSSINPSDAELYESKNKSNTTASNNCSSDLTQQSSNSGAALANIPVDRINIFKENNEYFDISKYRGESNSPYELLTTENITTTNVREPENNPTVCNVHYNAVYSYVGEEIMENDGVTVNVTYETVKPGIVEQPEIYNEGGESTVMISPSPQLQLINSEQNCTEWSPQETFKFYNSLKTFKTDFKSMQALFPDRDEDQLILKFRIENRHNSDLIALLLTKPENVDIESLRTASLGSGRNNSEEVNVANQDTSEQFNEVQHETSMEPENNGSSVSFTETAVLNIETICAIPLTDTQQQTLRRIIELNQMLQEIYLDYNRISNTRIYPNKEIITEILSLIISGLNDGYLVVGREVTAKENLSFEIFTRNIVTGKIGGPLCLYSFLVETILALMNL